VSSVSTSVLRVGFFYLGHGRVGIGLFVVDFWSREPDAEYKRDEVDRTGAPKPIDPWTDDP